MKFHEDSKGFTLESADEVAEFQKLIDLGIELRKKQENRAQRVFEAFLEGSTAVDINDDSDSASKAAFAWAEKMSAAILNDLDHRSIGAFVDLILENHEISRQRALAIKRHASDPKQADKALVRECWDDWQKQPDRYNGKAAFARDMRDKFPNLESQPVIEGWCRKWERES